ncbi:hypothetical protein ACFY3U_16615 [Micromonospora sp. NPDC000089]|uniref:hypothetical protein n=1 Tax=unclassified Micromonospora TaxID=2617518 RepID=UPI0036A7F505
MRGIMDAALRRQRIGLVVAVVVGLLTGVADLKVGDIGGPLVLLTLVPLAVFFGFAIRDLLRSPSAEELRVDERERVYYAPPRQTIGFMTVFVGFALYRTVVSAGAPDRSTLDVGLAVMFAAIAIFSVLLGWFGLPGIELTTEGITHSRHERQWFVPWAALGTDGRVDVGWRSGNRVIWLPVARPELVRAGRGWGRGSRSVAVREVDAAPALVAGAIRHYLAHPEHRAAIGTEAEYARLRAALLSGG